MGIAAGVVKPEQQEKATPYKFHTDAEGRSVRINEATGATDVPRPGRRDVQAGADFRVHTLMEPDEGATRKRMSPETLQFLEKKSSVNWS